MKREKVLIIAEAGVNHNGDLNRAIELIKVASEAGADVVKFQTFKAEKLVSVSARKAEYQQKNNPGDDSTQFEMLKGLELDEKDHYTLKKECEKRRIQFLSTAFDEEGIEFLKELGIPFFKSPSGEITNRPYLIRLAKTGKPVILSTGMATMDEIRAAVDLMTENGLEKEDITVLHCSTDYPTSPEDVNLHAMNTIGRELGVRVGYSDHTLGIEVPIAATALGATVIEKHFTLDRSLPGPDHRASLEPEELKQMVTAIRNIEKAIAGDGLKVPTSGELKNRDVARKSLFVKSGLKEGQIIEYNDLIALRPGDGISPMDIDRVVGKKTTRTVNANEQLKWDWIE